MKATVDSNVLGLSEEICKSLKDFNPAQWPNDKDDNTILCNSPIYTNNSGTNPNQAMPTSTLKFVYLDYSRNILALKRMLKSLKDFENVVTFVNADYFNEGDYLIQPQNCSIKQLAIVLALIIKCHIKKGSQISKIELMRSMCPDNDVGGGEDDDNYFDVRNILEMSNKCIINNDCLCPKKR